MDLDESLASITTKQGLIDYTTSAWNSLVTYVDGLTPEQWTGPKDAAGWSVKDHIAHVTKWDRAVIERLRDGTPMQATLGLSSASWSAVSDEPMNEEIRQLAIDDPVAVVQAERDATWTELVSLLGELDDVRLSRPGAEAGVAIGDRPLAGSLLQVLVDYWGEHYDEHLRAIETIVAGDST